MQSIFLSPGFCLAKCQTCFGYNVSNANYNLNEVSYSQKLAHRDCFAIAVKARSSVNKTKKQPKLVAFVLLVEMRGVEPLTS